MVRIGVIGYGYWGPNIVRNLNNAEGAQVAAVCDMNEQTLHKVKKAYPHVRICKQSQEITRAADIDAVAVITPVHTHFELAADALKNGKHVFMEKPFTLKSSEAEHLIELAAQRQLCIMVDHTFLFTGAVRRIKEIIDKHELGKVFYYDSTRVNLGLFQHDVNVIWDLAAHDFSIVRYLLPEKPISIVASGMSHINEMENIAYITIYFENNIIAHFNLNWLSPVKIRNTLIGGDKRMLVWDDISVDEKIRIYDKGVDVTSTEGIHNLLVSYRSGDMWVPKLDQREALKMISDYFIKCIEEKTTPINDGAAGLAVVRMLEASNHSLRNNGIMVSL